MHYPRTRRVQRIHLAHPLMARLGTAQVVLVDISLMGARIEHHAPLAVGVDAQLTFQWEDEEISASCRIIRSRLDRFSGGAEGVTVYHAGLNFDTLEPEMLGRLKRMIGSFIVRALEEQKMNARGVVPQDVTKMPIFRGDVLSADTKDVKGSSPVARIAKSSGYICCQLDRNTWRRKRTHDPGQPAEGFTVSALEDNEQVEKLCEAYTKLDREGRKMIQLFAQLSIMEGDAEPARRFNP